MGSRNYPNRDNGIYHSLPQFDPSLKGLTAIITGAWGISGFGTVRALLDSPHRWARVYTISRNPPPTQMLELLSIDMRSRIEHIPCDLLGIDPAVIAMNLRKAKVVADYVFYYAYLQPPPKIGGKPWSNDEQLVNVNAGMLRNFLEALCQADIRPKRILLQTGGKNYGAHIGRARAVCLESDPQPRHLGPNFYYDQEDLLLDYCEKYDVGWNVIRPAWIVGAANNAQMNAMVPFSIYAAVAAERDEPLVFNSNFATWQDDMHWASANLTGYLSEWAVLEDNCRNEAFNAQDTSPMSWDRIWEELVRWFGVAKGFVPPPDDDAAMFEWPIKGGKESPMGYGPPVLTKFAFLMLNWAQDPENAKAWRVIMERHGLTFDPFLDIEANFTFADAPYVKAGPLSMNKARRLGWTGFVDTRESIFQMYREMNLLQMCALLKVEHAKALI